MNERERHDGRAMQPEIAAEVRQSRQTFLGRVSAWRRGGWRISATLHGTTQAVLFASGMFAGYLVLAILGGLTFTGVELGSGFPVTAIGASVVLVSVGLAVDALRWQDGGHPRLVLPVTARRAVAIAIAIPFVVYCMIVAVRAGVIGGLTGVAVTLFGIFAFDRVAGSLWVLGSSVWTTWTRRAWTPITVLERADERVRVQLSDGAIEWLEATSPPMSDTTGFARLAPVSVASPSRRAEPTRLEAFETIDERSARRRRTIIATLGSIAGLLWVAVALSPFIGMSLTEPGEPLPFRPPD